MSNGINRVTLIGNMGKDPEMRYTQGGKAITSITLATSESWKNKQTGGVETRTEWHKVVFFNRLAEVVGQYLKKGSKVYVEGQLRTNKWTDNNNVDRYTTEIIASTMQMLDGKGSAVVANKAPDFNDDDEPF